MPDDELRRAERSLDQSPDPAAVERLILARRRAGLPVGEELLDRRVCPLRRIACRHDLAFLATPPSVHTKLELYLDADGDWLELPAHRSWEASQWPDSQDHALQALDDLAAAGCERLRLEGPALVGTLPHLDRLPLTHLSVAGNAGQTRQALSRVVELPQVVALTLEVEGEVADALPALARAPALERLSVRSHDASQALLETAAQLPALRALALDSRRPEEQMVLEPPAPGAGRRRELRPRPSPAPSSCLLDLLARLTRLEELDLSLNVDVDAEVVRRLASIAGLRRLGCRLRGDDTAEALARLPLEELSISDLSDRGLAALKGLPLQRLSLLGRSGVTESALATLPTTLRRLTLFPPVTDLSWLPRLLALEYLSLEVDLTHADPRLLEPVGALTHLERLRERLRRSGSTVDLAPLGRLERLWLLEITVKLDAAAVASFATLHALNTLELRDTGIDDAALVALAGLRLPLTRISIDGGAITDMGVRAIAALPSVRYLGVSECPGVTLDALRELAGTGCYVSRDHEQIALS